MSNFINNLFDGNLENFRKNVFDTLYSRAGDFLENAKKDLANNLYSENESQDDEIEQEIDQPEE